VLLLSAHRERVLIETRDVSQESCHPLQRPKSPSLGRSQKRHRSGFCPWAQLTSIRRYISGPRASHFAAAHPTSAIHVRA